MGLEQEWPGFMRIRCCGISITTFLSSFKQNMIPLKRITIQRYLKIKQLNGTKKLFYFGNDSPLYHGCFNLSKWDRLRFRYATEITLSACNMGTKNKWLFAEVEWLHKSSENQFASQLVCHKVCHFYNQT